MQLLTQNIEFGEAQPLFMSVLFVARRVRCASKLVVITRCKYSSSVSISSSGMRTTRSLASFHGPESAFRKKTEREIRASLWTIYVLRLSLEPTSILARSSNLRGPFSVVHHGLEVVLLHALRAGDDQLWLQICHGSQSVVVSDGVDKCDRSGFVSGVIAG